MNRWIDQGRHLSAMARYLRAATALLTDLVRQIADKAILMKDTIAAIEIIAVVIEKQATTLVNDVFVPAIRYLTAMGNARWVDVTWYMTQLPTFLRGLSEEQCKPVLENLTHRARIDYHDERVLQAIANSHSRIVWLFFKDRIDREKCKPAGKDYQAIPFQLRELQKALGKDAGLAIDIVREWYDPGDNLFQFRGGKLLHNVFPAFNLEFEARLLAFVRSGEANNIAFVLYILHSYRDGETFLHNCCKELVDVLTEDDKRINQVELILQSTGVVSGQFGFVEAFRRKKHEMEPWLNDARSKVRDFAERYCRSLDRRIASEQRRSEADYELRRREWPEEE
jgi:hypothetical protein